MEYGCAGFVGECVPRQYARLAAERAGVPHDADFSGELFRAFLHDAPFLLLDEPTSNLDSLNEGVILKSLEETCGEKTVVLVSHRKSTMNLADVVYEMKNGRTS